MVLFYTATNMVSPQSINSIQSFFFSFHTINSATQSASHKLINSKSQAQTRIKFPVTLREINVKNNGYRAQSKAGH